MEEKQRLFKLGFIARKRNSNVVHPNSISNGNKHIQPVTAQQKRESKTESSTNHEAKHKYLRGIKSAMVKHKELSGKQRKRTVHRWINKYRSKEKESARIPSYDSKYLITAYIRCIDAEKQNMKFSDITNMIFQYFHQTFKFDIYCKEYGKVTENGTRCIGMANGSHICCFVSSTGWNKGINQWNIKCYKQYGVPYIGVVSNYADAIRGDTWLIFDSLDNGSCARYGGYQDRSLSEGDIITVQLNCQLWTVYFWVNQEFQKEIQLKQKNISYHPSIEFWTHTPGDQDYKLLHCF